MVPVQLLGVCTTADQHDHERPGSRFLRADVDKAIRGALPAFLAKLAGDVPSEDKVDAFIEDSLWGTPIHPGSGDEADQKLQSNLLGHVALALAGVKKFVYAGAIQHVYALALAARSLRKQSDASLVIRRMLEAEFYLYPEDHHDHWHVVFPTRSRWLDGQTPELAVYLRFWQRLGIDFGPLRASLEQRRFSPGNIESDRQRLLTLLAAPPPAKDAALLTSVAEAITAQGYPSTGDLKPAFPDVTKRYRVDKWDDTPSDAEPQQ
jgi:hypothetical protein